MEKRYLKKLTKTMLYEIIRDTLPEVELPKMKACEFHRYVRCTRSGWLDFISLSGKRYKIAIDVCMGRPYLSVSCFDWERCVMVSERFVNLDPDWLMEHGYIEVIEVA